MSRSAAVKTDTPRGGRRTQAERLAETRARIIAATVAFIDEKGLHQTSLQQVARKAEVTVGAVQHHFSSKSELLAAVVEDSFQELTSNLKHLDAEDADLEQRIGLFVDGCWEFIRSPRYQAGLQILQGLRNEADEDFDDWLQTHLGHLVGEGFDTWLRLFSDVDFSQDEHFELLLYLFSSLSGSALLYRISQRPSRIDSDLRELKKLLLLRFNERLRN